MKLTRGFYVSLDGPDGCGKTTQYQKLHQRLLSDGLDVVTLREPGATKLGEHIREILLHNRDLEYSREVQMMLYQTTRRDLIEQIVLPALQQKKCVLSDRCHDSTTIYQGLAGNIPLTTIQMFNQYATCGRSPDISFILDVDNAQSALARATQTTADKLESEPLAFHEKVVKGFRSMPLMDENRCVLIPYIEGGIEETHERIYNVLVERMQSYIV